MPTPAHVRLECQVLGHHVLGHVLLQLSSCRHSFGFHVRIQIRLLAQVRVALELEHRLGCILGSRKTSCVDRMVRQLNVRQVLVLVEALLAPKRHLRLLLRAPLAMLYCGSRLQLHRLRRLGGRSCLSTPCGRDDYLHAAVELEADRACVHRRRYQPLPCVIT